VTAREFYAYRLQQRASSSDILFRAERLFQEFCCFSWVKTETTKLNFLRANQAQLRAELYHNLRDHVRTSDAQHINRVGVQVILPSTFNGSPRDTHARYQDAMAAVRVHGKPDLFITFTCNPKHPDILDNLPGQHPKDRPDIVARVFKGQLDNLIHELKVDCIFGKPVALVYSIEFQQRGLPHAHILLTLDSRSKMNSSDNIDKAVRAELPQHQASALRHTVLTCLVHNPCGPMHRNVQNACVTVVAQNTFQSHIVTLQAGQTEIYTQATSADVQHHRHRGFKSSTLCEAIQQSLIVQMLSHTIHTSRPNMAVISMLSAVTP
jgi:hypothetical protein